MSGGFVNWREQVLMLWYTDTVYGCYRPLGFVTINTLYKMSVVNTVGKHQASNHEPRYSNNGMLYLGWVDDKN